MLSLFSPRVVTNIRNNRNGGIYNIRYTIFSITNVFVVCWCGRDEKVRFYDGGGVLWRWGDSFSNFWEPKMMSQAFLGPMPKLQLFQFFFSDSNNARCSRPSGVEYILQVKRWTYPSWWLIQQISRYSVVTSLETWVLVYFLVCEYSLDKSLLFNFTK